MPDSGIAHWKPSCGGSVLGAGCRRIASSKLQPDDQVEGSVIKHEQWNKRREVTSAGSIRPAAGASFTASRKETVGPGSKLPAHAGTSGRARRAPRRRIRPSDAPQEILGLPARRPPGGITDPLACAHDSARGVHNTGCRPAPEEVSRSHPDGYSLLGGTELLTGSGVATA